MQDSNKILLQDWWCTIPRPHKILARLYTIMNTTVLITSYRRGNRTPGSCIATGCNSLVAQARHCSSIQLTHMSPIARSAMASKGRQELITAHNVSSTVIKFRHVSISEQQRSCGAFVRAVLAMNFEESDRAMVADSITKALVSPPPR